MQLKSLLAKGIVLALILGIGVQVAQAQLCVPPLISTQPVGVSVCNGNVATFVVVGVGLNLSYQWQVDNGSGYTNCSNGSTYSGALTASLHVTASIGLNANRYRCIISNPCGSITSGSCILTILSPNVTVSASPSSTICAGSSTTLTASGAS